MIENNKGLGYTYVDQECIHSLDVSLEPAVRVVALAVFAENLLVAVDDPGVHTQDNLELLISTSEMDQGGLLTPSGKYFPAIVIPPLGTIRGRLWATPGWNRYASFNFTTVSILGYPLAVAR